MSFEICGMDWYHFVMCFVWYSMLGWLVESIYMSICEKKLTNRGFGKGPFCPIYGVGALGAVIFFNPLKGHFVAMYFTGCVVATTFEYLVGIGMIYFLGELWWDYHNKPFNYKGILCLESTLAWGVYAILIVHVIQPRFMMFIDRIEQKAGYLFLGMVFVLWGIDYMLQIRKALENKHDKADMNTIET